MIRYFKLLFLLAAWHVNSNSNSSCGKEEKSLSYLDVAADMIEKAKYNISRGIDRAKCLTPKAVDCADILHMGFNKSGVYTIWPMNKLTENKALDVYCDMQTDGGGWTLIQRRGNFQRKKDYFYKDWKSYKEGFGDIEKDFWLGNDNIFALTNQRTYSGRFDLKDVVLETRYAQYDNFWIDDENRKYTLHVADYRGDAGDSIIQTTNNNHNNQKFSTKDQDNDGRNKEPLSCAQMYKGGWWYNDCHQSNLNGQYLRGKHESHADGVNWFTWKGYKESLESTEIKVRPKNFRKSHFSASTPM